MATSTHLSSTSGTGPSLNTTSKILHAIAHPLRIRMLQYIDEHQPVCVNKINVDLNIDQSITSQHLRLLRMAELVEYTRDGKYINYSINPKRIAEVTQVAKELAGLFDQKD